MKMKIVVVEDTLKDVEALKNVLTKENLQEYMNSYDDVFDSVSFIGYHEDITKDELEETYDHSDDVIAAIKKELDEEIYHNEEYKISILLDIILTKKERLSALQSNNPPEIELAKKIIHEFSEQHHICLITNYENYTRYYETMIGSDWKDRYVVKSEIKREDEFMMKEMVRILVKGD